MKKINNIIYDNLDYFKAYLIKGQDGDVLIDTGFSSSRKKLKRLLDKNNVKLIILTHAHLDHVWNAKYFKKRYGCQIAISKNDLENLDNSIINSIPVNKYYNFSAIFANYFMKRIKIEAFIPDLLLEDNQLLNLYGLNLKVVSLKGHTKGSIGILYKDYMFVGDALVNRKYYVELPYQMQNKIEALASVKKILEIKPKLIFIGHENPIKFEKLVNSMKKIETQ
ncbi:MAG: MBL fold metallo-hydrolase [Bacilli bacterium]